MQESRVREEREERIREVRRRQTNKCVSVLSLAMIFIYPFYFVSSSGGGGKKEKWGEGK